jgi:hypothetical protein
MMMGLLRGRCVLPRISSDIYCWIFSTCPAARKHRPVGDVDCAVGCDRQSARHLQRAWGEFGTLAVRRDAKRAPVGSPLRSPFFEISST